MLMNSDELRRLENGPTSGERPKGIVCGFLARCDGNAPEVLARCKEVLRVVLTQDVEHWPTDGEWRSLLPAWFVSKCMDEDSYEARAKKLFEFPEEERLQHDLPWAVSGWVFWFAPDEREWFWWDAAIKDKNTIEIFVDVFGDPFPWGGLSWLLKASGTVSVE